MISVLMSVYKEKLTWLKSSLESMMNQTYPDLEIIVVVDNPDISEEVARYLAETVKSDPRIVLSYNDHNIGLARSMNKALELAKGDYVARMDADDIAETDRLQKQLVFLNKSGADLVAGNIRYIDADGKVLNENPEIKTNVEKYLPYRNVIFHPTVLAKTVVFRSIGGYRNFFCSQDYDAWLRVLGKGFVIRNMTDYVLNYRVSDNNITAQKRVEQFYTAMYQRRLYRERLKKKTDSFSDENYKKFLESKHITERKREKFVSARKYLSDFAKEFRKKNVFSIISLIRSFFLYPEVTIEYFSYQLHTKNRCI